MVDAGASRPGAERGLARWLVVAVTLHGLVGAWPAGDAALDSEPPRRRATVHARARPRASAESAASTDEPRAAAGLRRFPSFPPTISPSRRAETSRLQAAKTPPEERTIELPPAVADPARSPPVETPSELPGRRPPPPPIPVLDLPASDALATIARDEGSRDIPYPVWAEPLRLEARVIVELEIDPSGHVTRVHVLENSGHPRFTAYVEAELPRCLRYPPRTDGVDAPRRTTERIHFDPARRR